MASLTVALLSKEVLAEVMGAGCFSAANDDCNGANGRFLSFNWWSCVFEVLASSYPYIFFKCSFSQQFLMKEGE